MPERTSYEQLERLLDGMATLGAGWNSERDRKRALAFCRQHAEEENERLREALRRAEVAIDHWLPEEGEFRPDEAYEAAIGEGLATLQSVRAALEESDGNS